MLGKKIVFYQLGEGKMKILVSRRIRPLATFHPKIIRTEWVKKEFTCQQCGCKFKLQANDKAEIYAQILEIDGGIVGVDTFLNYLVYCPTGCGATIKIGGKFKLSEEELKQHTEPKAWPIDELYDHRNLP